MARMQESAAAVTRREWLGTVVGTSAMLLASPLGRAVAAMTAPVTMTVYKSPTCGCCRKWIEHAQRAGFTVVVKDTPDVTPTKRTLGVPESLWSCHTAVVGGYAIEGHVPLDLVSRLLREKPRAAGLAVPGMPAGSPGMEVGGMKDPYDVVLFQGDGKTSVYAKR